MSEWITDRLPTSRDCVCGLVWAWVNDGLWATRYHDVKPGCPWMSLIEPEPYVEPKRVRKTWEHAQGNFASPLLSIQIFQDDPADWDEALIQVREVEIELRSLADVTDDKKHSDFLEQLADQLHDALQPRSEK